MFSLATIAHLTYNNPTAVARGPIGHALLWALLTAQAEAMRLRAVKGKR